MNLYNVSFEETNKNKKEDTYWFRLRLDDKISLLINC